jgi:WD40 repeat protein
MFRWLLISAALCAGAYYVVTRMAPTDTNIRNAGDQGGRLSDSVETFPRIGPGRIEGHANGHRPVIINGAHIMPLERQDVGSEREGSIVLYGTELKPGEEKTLPPSRIISQPFVYIAVEVDYDPRTPANSYPLVVPPEVATKSYVPLEYTKDPASLKQITNYFTLDDSKKYYTRWKEGMPLYAKHVVVLNEVRKFRKLKEQDLVEKGEMLALINPELAITELRNKHIKLDAAEADRQSSANTRDEAITRRTVLEQMQARTPLSVSPEEMRGAQLNVVRYTQEEIAKRAQVRAAEFDVIAAMKVVTLHEVRAAMSGMVKTINKNRGDSVKANQDTLLQIVDPLTLQAEAYGEVQDVQKLRLRQPVQLEVSLRVTPKTTLPGVARRDINAVAVSNGAGAKGKSRLIIAASEDGTLRCWDAATGQEYWSPVQLPTPARALACTPQNKAVKKARENLDKAEKALKDSKDDAKMKDLENAVDDAKAALKKAEDSAKDDNLLLVGAADGSAHVYDLANLNAPPVPLPEMHKGPIAAVAFSPDGKTCATAGGDDRAIMIWSLSKAAWTKEPRWDRQQVLADAHRGGITSLAFTDLAHDGDSPADETSNWRLISAGRDNALIAWKAEKGKPLVKDPGMEFTRRSGDVTQFSSDGERVLVDSGKELRVVSLRERRIVGTLRNPGGAGSFSTMALFSPDGLTVLTVGPEGHPQLWRAPPKAGKPDYLAEGRGSELREFASNSTVTCGALDPEGAFAVTGTQEGQVLVWEMPRPEEVGKRIPATLALVEDSEGTFKQAKVRAEVKEVPLWYKLNAGALAALRSEGVPDATLSKLNDLKDKESIREVFVRELDRVLSKDENDRFQAVILSNASTRPWLVPGSTATIVVVPEQ